MAKGTNQEHWPVDLGGICVLCKKPTANHRVYHKPMGNPCRSCGLPADRHRVKHEPDGHPCSCGVPDSGHLGRTRTLYETWYRHHISNKPAENIYFGIDGEGRGRDEHKYVLLAASDDTGKRQFYVENEQGLSTEECFDFLLGLPRQFTQFFTFAFNYDLTKILTDVDDEIVFSLFRPQTRQRLGGEARKGPYHRNWRGYQINWQAAKFSVRWKNHIITIWDLFKFYQSRFTVALKDWKVADPKRIEYIERMKEQRSEFDKLSMAEIRPYCLEECLYMAQMARKLNQAHRAVELELKTYYGAGSSASAMLSAMEIKPKIRQAPDELSDIVSTAFFGGRFENSMIGPVRQELEGWDISSAYPYQLCFLPCLEHGTWEHTAERTRLNDGNVKTALVRYSLSPEKGQASKYWGPFPFRLKDGTTAYPAASGGGWLYLEEYLSGEKLFAGVNFHEAWLYKSECTCQPFSRIPQFYLERLRIGKEGPGIVLKLGMNSCYGKLAQSVGSAPFNCWIWAGLITSGTRAQILQLMGRHKKLANVLSIATDGIISLEKLTPPLPRDTGTFSAVTCDKCKQFSMADPIDSIHHNCGGIFLSKALGGWENKPIPKGMFFARPGIHFPLTPTVDEIEKVRARGLGRKVLFESWRTIQSDWEAGLKTVRIAEISRFMGAKSSIHFSHRHGFRRAFYYGQWIKRPVEMSFNPLPKRKRALPNGCLILRRFSQSLQSIPYKRSRLSVDAILLKRLQDEVIEQPEGVDWSDYEQHNE